jgi:hypothetical protein
MTTNVTERRRFHWGMASIAQVLDTNPPALYNKLRYGSVPGISKVRGTYCLDLETFVRETFAL